MKTKSWRVGAQSFTRVAAFLSRLALPSAFIILSIVDVRLLDRMPNLCVYQTLFHVRCLGCGMTHAFCSVLHGHFAAALAFNPLVVIAFPVFAAIAIRNLRSLIQDAARSPVRLGWV
ncbi:MAG TPA: DUF2752 domain-containing protein [Candidatus Angelobacter sp.]